MNVDMDMNVNKDMDTDIDIDMEIVYVHVDVHSHVGICVHVHAPVHDLIRFHVWHVRVHIQVNAYICSVSVFLFIIMCYFAILISTNNFQDMIWEGDRLLRGHENGCEQL
jgi:hypothetical protein